MRCIPEELLSSGEGLESGAILGIMQNIVGDFRMGREEDKEKEDRKNRDKQKKEWRSIRKRCFFLVP